MCFLISVKHLDISRQNFLPCTLLLSPLFPLVLESLHLNPVTEIHETKQWILIYSSGGLTLGWLPGCSLTPPQQDDGREKIR